jgi:hypothetical protein
MLCLFPWPLRSHLGLPPDIGYFVHTDSGDAIIRCRTTEGASILSYTGSEYPWLTSDYPGYKAEWTIRYQSGVAVPARYTYFRGEDPFIDAVVYPGRYTQLEVAFEIDGYQVLDDEQQFSALLSWVELVVRQFVDLYRALTQEIDVVEPRVEDLDQTNVFVSDDYAFRSSGFEAEFRPHRPRFHVPQRAALQFHKSETPEPVVDQLTQLLRQGYHLPFSQQLLLQAKQQAHEQHNYDLCIVLIATAFEVFMREILLSTCAARGVATLTTRRGGTASSLPYADAVAAGEVRRDLLQYVDELGGDSARDRRKYNAWYTDAYQVRNRIIHRGEVGFNNEVAEKAFTATSTYMDHIRGSLV